MPKGKTVPTDMAMHDGIGNVAWMLPGRLASAMALAAGLEATNQTLLAARKTACEGAAVQLRSGSGAAMSELCAEAAGIPW